MFQIQWSIDPEAWVDAETFVTYIHSGVNVGLYLDKLSIVLAGPVHLVERSGPTRIMLAADPAWAHLPSLQKYRSNPRTRASATDLFRGFDLSILEFADQLADEVPLGSDTQSPDGMEWKYWAMFQAMELIFHSADDHVFVFSKDRRSEGWMLVFGYAVFIAGVQEFLGSFVDALASNLPELRPDDIPGRLGQMLQLRKQSA